MGLARVAALIFLCVVASACTKKVETNTSAASPEAAAGALVERGRTIYKLNCIACHNTDPAVDGVLGPSVKGASLELLSARVLKAQYPSGYKPKRESHTMPALPQLEKELSALNAFLNAP